MVGDGKNACPSDDLTLAGGTMNVAAGPDAGAGKRTTDGCA